MNAGAHPDCGLLRAGRGDIAPDALGFCALLSFESLAWPVGLDDTGKSP
ncbi:hypothetical protein LB518_21330 [Mesorhizobium sp. BR1-1-16]|nr:hypothetical protein [Mesorhizobium sp. BR1-1-16]MBZ9938853.1 hypothetical protein [Mesorhizobium sp. BR1-1-16]